MPRQSNQPSRIVPARGFTLIELMITIAIAAVLLAIAVPSFRHALAKTNAAQTSNALMSSLYLARSQAVSNGRVACVEANSAGWVDGWDVKLDMDGDSGCDGTTDSIVRSYGKLDSRFHLTATASATEIAFKPSGALSGSETSVTVCRTGDRKAQAVKVTVRGSGAITSHRDASVTGATCS